MIDTDVLDIMLMCALKSYMITFLDLLELNMIFVFVSYITCFLHINIMDHMNGTFEMICEY